MRQITKIVKKERKKERKPKKVKFCKPLLGELSLKAKNNMSWDNKFTLCHL